MNGLYSSQPYRPFSSPSFGSSVPPSYDESQFSTSIESLFISHDMTLKDLLSKLLKSNECLLTLIESSMISYPWKQFFFQQLLDFNSGLFLTIYSRLSFLFFQQNQSLPIQKDFLDIIQPIFDIFSESYKPVISDEREFKRDRLGLLSKTKSDMAILFDVYEVHNNQLELKNRLKKASKDVEINRSQANHIRLARLGAKGRG